jgi:hypothetical protein
VSKPYVLKACRSVEVKLYEFLASFLDGSKHRLCYLSALLSRKRGKSLREDRRLGELQKRSGHGDFGGMIYIPGHENITPVFSLWFINRNTEFLYVTVDQHIRNGLLPKFS